SAPASGPRARCSTSCSAGGGSRAPGSRYVALAATTRRRGLEPAGGARSAAAADAPPRRHAPGGASKLDRALLPTEHLPAFLLIAGVLILVPGPSVLFVVTRSLTLGRGAGLATVFGNSAGVYLQVVAVAFGLGALVRESIAVFTVVKLAGAVYLVYLGVQ